jgi:hypothetical protein
MICTVQIDTVFPFRLPTTWILFKNNLPLEHESYHPDITAQYQRGSQNLEDPKIICWSLTFPKKSDSTNKQMWRQVRVESKNLWGSWGFVTWYYHFIINIWTLFQFMKVWNNCFAIILHLPRLILTENSRVYLSSSGGIAT